MFSFLIVATALYVVFGSELPYAQSPSAQGAANDVRAACAQDVQSCALMCRHVKRSTRSPWTVRFARIGNTRGNFASDVLAWTTGNQQNSGSIPKGPSGF